MKTSVIKHENRLKLDVLSVAEYKRIESEDVIVNVSMFFDPFDEKHTTVISYHA
ncbi:hypothetical protein [Aquimarina macrocephali]|uniref:hypothetical protein n=1 Tax=Aquimarina macrocephali TaxID=666563 RepID=UPI003F67248A